MAQLTADDFAVVARRQPGEVWGDLPEEEKAAMKRVRATLVSLGEELLGKVRAETDLQVATSSLLPHNVAARDVWGCLFPAVVADKSYALQLFYIVTGDGMEVGVGWGTGYTKRSDHQEMLSAMEEAQINLGQSPDPSKIEDLSASIARANLFYRREWRRAAGQGDFDTLPEWLAFAAGPDGRGSAISSWLPATEIVDVGDRLADRVAEILNVLSPLMDAAYASGGAPADDFALAWRPLLEHLRTEPSFTTLDFRVRAEVLSVDTGDISFRTSNSPAGSHRTLSRRQARRAWNELREKGESGLGFLQTAEKALIALLPNVEFDLKPMRFYWVDPKSHETGTLHRRGSSPDASATSNWVFQANPVHYDIDGAAAHLKQLTWLVTAHASDIRPNHRVFVWRSGRDAGMVAMGSVLTAPQLMPDGDAEAPYRRSDEKFAGERLRAVIRLDRVLRRPLSRAAVLSEPLLRDVAIFRGWQGTNFPLTPQEAARLTEMIEQQPTDGPGIATLPDPALPRDKQLSLANALLLEPKWLEDVLEILRSHRQLIFYGPPGTGKTFVARKIAAEVAASSGGLHRLVQFHPSYAYEDFVEGYRPALVNGRPGFELRDGPLKEIAAEAQRNPGAYHVLIIDEINRGNLAKVFGELYFLMEYRNEAARLQYSPDDFELPPNLWIIGTMNTADRSIALLDAALRRRFHFSGLFPDTVPVKGLLKRWLEQENADYAWVADRLDALNAELERDIAVGPSYFMREGLDAKALDRVWTYQIRPLLEDLHFEDRAKLKVLDALWEGPSDHQPSESGPTVSQAEPATGDDASASAETPKVSETFAGDG